MERREVDAVGVVFGLLFAGIGASVLAGVADELVRLDWVWPVLLLVLGTAMIVQASFRLGRRGRPPAVAGDAEPEAGRDAEPGAAPEAPTLPLAGQEREGERP